MAKEVTLLDYGAGNVRSIRNAITRLGFTIIDVKDASDIESAKKLIFPGVGAFKSAVENLHEKRLFEPLKKYLQANRPFFGICIGLQLLFEGSDENPGVEGLGIIPGRITKFDVAPLSVPHMGWNGVSLVEREDKCRVLSGDEILYFVHSYCPLRTEKNAEWIATATNYGKVEFISSVQRGNIIATQFHPEKSGLTGVNVLRRFLEDDDVKDVDIKNFSRPTTLRKRVIACLDVRTNDEGDLVVTKGDQYDVRETAKNDPNHPDRKVRNLGKPVALARRYFEEGADEITFLNITSFRESPLQDSPMLRVLEETSENVFVPLTIGGGIRSYTDKTGRKWSALDVANQYFRSGADKVSIGSDAVYCAEDLISRSGKCLGNTAIEEISRVYGSQAVVISVDPRRVFVNSPKDTHHTVLRVSDDDRGPNGEQFCWYQCTVRGGREGRDLDAHQLVKSCETLGAGEILLNCIHKDGTKSGFDIPFIESICNSVTIPVIASSGAGTPQHFSEVFANTTAEAALAAGIFHRKEVPLQSVKAHLQSSGIPTRSAQGGKITTHI
uniref:Imidazole glycerol phosphate synthase hisHF n=2 Tax=Hirondellea gigas TaxID=1518452 RepID=A0A6A7G6S7_9CRUS